MAKKHDDTAAEGEATPPTERQQFEAAIDAIACGVRRLTEAGMGAACAGDLAAKVYQQTCCGGRPCPAAE